MIKMLKCFPSVFQVDICDSLRSMEMSASRAALVCGLVPKYWASSGGLSGRWGLSIWSEGGSSLIPLSLGEGDQRGEPDTESFPLRRALRKSSSVCSAGCSICWVKNPKLSLGCLCEMTTRWDSLLKTHRACHGGTAQYIQSKQLFLAYMSDIKNPTVSHTFDSWTGQVWWLPWRPVSSWRRIPSFWSNSQSSSSMPSQPWNEIMTFNDSTHAHYVFDVFRSKDNNMKVSYAATAGDCFLLPTTRHDPPWTHHTVLYVPKNLSRCLSVSLTMLR